MEFSRCTRAAPAENRRLKADGLSKLNSVNIDEVDVLLGDLVYRTEREIPSNGPGASGVRAPDSLERR
jgi:hypothetical protein